VARDDTPFWRAARSWQTVAFAMGHLSQKTAAAQLESLCAEDQVHLSGFKHAWSDVVIRANSR
jgi:hypothetical protein